MPYFAAAGCIKDSLDLIQGLAGASCIRQRVMLGIKHKECAVHLNCGERLVDTFWRCRSHGSC